MSRKALTSAQERQVVTAYEAGATCRELAAQYGCSDVSIRNALKRSGATMRTTSESRAVRRRWGSEVEEEALQQYRDGLSVKQLAKHWGVRTSVISEFLERRQEPLHPGGKDHPRFRSLQQCQELASIYHEGTPASELAKRFKCSTPTIINALRKAGVKVSLGRPPFWTPERLTWIADEYTSGRSQQSIADELKVHQTAVSARLRQMGIYSYKHPRGEDHHSWQGGRSAKKDQYVWVIPTAEDLQFCVPMSNGYVQEHRLVMARALGRKLTEHETVHHIDGNKHRNVIENLQLRQGKHGKGVVMTCNSCGSHDIVATEIADEG